MLRSIRKQSHMSCFFDCRTQTALMFRARASFPAWLDLPAIRDIAFHEAPTGSFFIINFADVIMTKLTNFAASRTLASSAFTPLATWTFTSSLHGLSPLLDDGPSYIRRDDRLNLQEGRCLYSRLLRSSLNHPALTWE